VWLALRIAAERADGDTEDADRLLKLVNRMAVHAPSDEGLRAVAIAEHARLVRSDPAGAWSAAVNACRSMNEVFPLAYALLRHAEAIAAAGEHASAAEASAEALDLAQEMGAAPLVEEISAFIRAAQLPAADAPSNGSAAAEADELEEFGLTSREREVLMLIADGRSNGQIADKLVISRKTASVHVSNILAKLGVATRIEAAALVHRRGLAGAPADG
jgi:DNA-binding CsgD family transcriptional regulator